MTKIDITSDLHLDFWIDANASQKKQEKRMRSLLSCMLPDEPSNTLVIAGDTGHYNQQNELFIKILKETYNNICVVFGNHDLYLVSNSISKKFGGNSFNRLSDFIERLGKIEGVHYLDGTMVDIDGITIGGHGMWYDASYAINNWGYTKSRVEALWYNYLNDCNYIRVPDANGYLNPLDFITESANAKKTLFDIFDKSHVIVTHINPDSSQVPARYNEPGSTFYHFDGSDILSRGGEGKTWVFGHTHDPILDIHEGGCVFATAPLGYPSNSIGNSTWDYICDYHNMKPKQLPKGFKWPEDRRFRTVIVGEFPTYDGVFDQLPITDVK